MTTDSTKGQIRTCAAGTLVSSSVHFSRGSDLDGEGAKATTIDHRLRRAQRAGRLAPVDQVAYRTFGAHYASLCACAPASFPLLPLVFLFFSSCSLSNPFLGIIGVPAWELGKLRCPLVDQTSVAGALATYKCTHTGTSTLHTHPAHIGLSCLEVGN